MHATRGAAARALRLHASFGPAFARGIGAKGVPEEWGQPKSGGTGFLGTPTNYLDLVKTRPLSPDVFGLDGYHAHYKLPPVAVSSIMNRVTGAVVTGAVCTGGVVALVGDLPALIEAVKSLGPGVVIPLKFALAFPIVYHTLGGFRHLVWDYTLRGIDNASADTSSKVLMAVSLVSSAGIAAITL